MVRLVGAVIVGYLAMGLILMLLLMGMQGVLGFERAFQPESWEPSTLWISLSLAVGLLAAIVGGEVAYAIGGERAANVLTILVLALGLAAAIATLNKPRSTSPRPAQPTMQQVIENASTPIWVAFVNPVLGAIGVRLAVLRRGKGPAVSAPPDA